MPTSLTQKIDQLADVAREYIELTNGLVKDLDAIKLDMKDYRAYVPFLGVFTVGKSSLLNDWLGEKLLPEAQGPTTALATELLPGPAPEMVIVCKDGSERRLDYIPSDDEEANTREASDGVYAYCTSPSPNLQKVFPVVPVDMPGINSGIKRHTEALYAYANRGAAFFLIFMPEEGTLPAAMKAFLEELNLNGRPVFMVMTKCDTATEEKVTSVTDAIIAQLRNIGVEPRGVLHCARGSGETASTLEQALLSLNVGELNDRQHWEAVMAIGLRLKDQIATLRESQELDSNALEKEIRLHERAQRELVEAMQKEEQKLGRRLRNLPAKVGDDIYNALMENRGGLIAALENGQDAFATRMAGIINKVANESLSAAIQKDYSEMAMGVASDLQLDDNPVFDTEQYKNVLKTTMKTLNSISAILKTVQSNAKWYRMIMGGLAITTSVIAPIIEIVIVLLPDIINLFYNNEEHRRERISEALTEKVFPQVQTHIITEVGNMLPMIERELVNAMRNSWMDRLEDAKSALEAAKAGKEKAQDDFTKTVAGLDGTLAKINAILADLRAMKKTPINTAIANN